MGWSTNQKANAKREREDAKKKQNAQKKQQERQGKKWKDSQTDKAMNAKKQKQDKRQKQIARKQELRELAQKQQRQMEKINKKKETFATKKLTQAEIARNVEENQVQKETKNDEHLKVFYQENPNHALQEHQVATTVDEALRVLDGTQEKHPEKRYKAAFEAFSQKRQTQLKFQFPKMKRSQRIQLMRKQFQKHPDNPYNKNIVAYNDKSKKQARLVKEEQERQKQQQKKQPVKQERAGSDQDD